VPLAQQHLAVAEARCVAPLAVSVLDLSPRSTLSGLAGPVLDLYACTWQGQPLWADEYVLSADEKTSIQVRRRRHPTLPTGPFQATRFEHEYARGGALQYLAAWDVHRAEVFGRCEPRTGKAAFGRLVDQVMEQEPYRSARRVFWIVDNGPSHRGQRAADELRDRHPRVVIVHTPVHASWLNQTELRRTQNSYFLLRRAGSLQR
jgi:hypothetical protein